MQFTNLILFFLSVNIILIAIFVQSIAYLQIDNTKEFKKFSLKKRKKGGSCDWHFLVL
jgi:hypothetical protein